MPWQLQDLFTLRFFTIKLSQSKSKLVWIKYEQCFIKNSENYLNLRKLVKFKANQLKFDEKCPILLRNDSKFTSFVVLKCYHL